MDDLKCAIRQLLKNPGFTFVAVATLAIGIGANTAIFSAVDAVLLRPQPYPEPYRLVRIFERVRSGKINSVSGAAFLDWRNHQTHFEAIIILAHDQFDLTGLGDPEKINALSVSSEFNRVLGMPSLLGRGFRPEDDQVGGQNNVVSLTESFWRSRFGGSPDVIGQKLILDGAPREIIGVMPDGASEQRHISVFVPYVLTPGSPVTSYHTHRSRVLGRLKPDATLAAAEAELNAIKQRLRATYPEYKQSWGVALRPMQSFMAREAKPVLLLLFGAVVLVLMIACANVANLLLVRASARQREMAMRVALGASSSRVVRQVFTESLLLALLGGCSGVVLATWSIQLLGSLSAELLPATMMPRLDIRVLGFCLFASCATGLAFGIFPAWRVRRPDLSQALKGGGTGSTDGSRTRSQSTLVVAEVALTAVLLVGTGLLVRGMVQTVTADPGLNPKNVLMFDLTMPFSEDYQGQTRRMAFMGELISAMEAVPGVKSVASAENLPFSGYGQASSFSLEERPETRQDRSGPIEYVSPRYFEVLGATILRGRSLTRQDNRADAPPVMVVNQTLVNVLFGDEDPIGRFLHVTNQAWEIVGVSADIRVDGLHTPPGPTFYAAHWHFPWKSSFMVRTEGDPLAMAKAISEAVHRRDPMLPLANLRNLEHAMADSLGPQKLILNLITLFAAVALVLACIGLYGVMACSVASRERELGVRLALGATRRNVVGLILRDGGRLMGVGLLIGIIAAIGGSRLLASQLYGISSYDPLVLGTSILVLAGVSLFACWLPARLAAKVDPMVALRSE